ncbi:MAG: radical SAM protein [Myxococcota bacterium]
MDRRISQELRRLRASERGPGTVLSDAPLRFALAYPSPYSVAMSSLGYLQIHRLANARPGTRCERAVLPEPELLARHFETRTPLLTLESGRPISDFHLIGMSHAYELEMTGIANVLRLGGLEPLAEDRGPSDPLVVLGGPITNANPFPSAPFADLLILGEGERCTEQLLERLEAEPEAARGSASARKRLLEDLAGLPGFFVPEHHGTCLPPIARAPDHRLPAISEIRTPHAELSNMVLVEPERGCHRGCTFCVMRRTTNGGMRLVEPDKIFSLVPEDASKVGLVGAAVTDHPRIKDILSGLVDERGLKIGISSLRADRLDADFVGLLARGGYRSLTVALDAPSARLRWEVEKNIRDEHILRAAELAKAAGLHHLKLYVVVGLPGETDADRQELVDFFLRLRKTLPVVLGISPFVPKFHTPLADAPFCGEKEVKRILDFLRRALGGKAKLRGPGCREAYVEYRLSQGSYGHAQAAVAAAARGSTLTAWKKALADLPERVRPQNFPELIPPPTRRAPRRVAP